MGAAELKTFESWTGKRIEYTDEVSASPASRLLAWLDREKVDVARGDPLVPGGHLLYFLSTTRQSALLPDGGNPRDDLLPPIPLPRKLWLGSRLWFHQPLRIGDPIRRVASLKSVTLKQGRSGNAVFITLRDEISGPEGLAVIEEFDLLCREESKSGEALPQPQPRPAEPQWARAVATDPVLLFKFSALTYNSHRIHYDHPYTTGVEGYPGLLVTGPLQEVLLLDLVARELPAKRIVRFECRAVRPIFAGAVLRVEGRATDAGAEVWTCDAEGIVGMTATVELA